MAIEIVDFLINNGDSPEQNVSLPEGMWCHIYVNLTSFVSRIIPEVSEIQPFGMNRNLRPHR